MDKKPCDSSSLSLDAEVRKGPWTMEEDLILISYIANHGEGVWNSLAKSAGLKRTGKSCRLRWLNYLRPDVRRGNITPEEHLLIMELHAKWGNRWSKIAKHLPGRTDNEIKNYWRTRIQKHIKQAENFHELQQINNGGYDHQMNDLGQQASTSQVSYTSGPRPTDYSPPSSFHNQHHHHHHYHHQASSNMDDGDHNHATFSSAPLVLPSTISTTTTTHHDQDHHHHQSSDNYWSMEELWSMQLLNGD